MLTQRSITVAAAAMLFSCEVITTAADDSDQCLLYLAESTIPNAGLGMFTGVPVVEGQLLGRVGDAAIATVDQHWHMSPATGENSRHSGDYHWPLTNYDWNAPDVGLGDEAADISVTVNGFGAAPNCHFSLLNVDEHGATYDAAGLNRYTSPGAGAITPWWNRTSTATRDIAAGSELFVDYDSSWFTHSSREGHFQLVPLATSYKNALAFLKQFGKMLVDTDSPEDLVEDKMMIGDEVQKDLWDIIKTHPYVSRERQALPETHKDGIRAIKAGDIMTVEVENSIRSIEYLEEQGKCVDNIVPKQSTIPHAGRGAFATRFIPKGGLVAPAPLVHMADKSKVNMLYAEKKGPTGNIIRDEENIVHKQLILNYCFGHPNSTLLLFPYSSNVVYINHHSTKYNAKLRWTTDFDFYHHKEWLEKSVDFLEDQWAAGLMLEFVATRDIQPGEEVFIDYGEEWQKAWDEHVKKWEPTSKESDYNNMTWWTKKTEQSIGDHITAYELNKQDVPIRTLKEQQSNPYPHSLVMQCYVNINHDASYLFTPKTTPVYRRPFDKDNEFDHLMNCQVIERYEREDEVIHKTKARHKYLYVVEIDVEKTVGDGDDSSFREHHIITDVPRGAFKFVKNPGYNPHYTSDVFLKNAFRHEMKLPDEMFPKSWMNFGEEQKQKAEPQKVKRRILTKDMKKGKKGFNCDDSCIPRLSNILLKGRQRKPGVK